MKINENKRIDLDLHSNREEFERRKEETTEEQSEREVNKPIYRIKVNTN